MPQKTSFQSDNMQFPTGGCLALPWKLDFTESGTIHEDFSDARQNAWIDFIQTVYVDNADNTAPLDLIFDGGQYPQRVRVAAYHQGFFPVTLPLGSGARFKAITAQGQSVNIIFYNTAFPYFEWGPEDGALVVPALTNVPLAPLALIIGETELVPAIGGESIKLYRGIFGLDTGALLQFLDGPGGAVLFSGYLFAGGSLTFQASGIPWFAASTGKSLVIKSDTVTNLYGGFGVTQS